MKALIFERSIPRYAMARAASTFHSGGGAKFGPLRLADVAEPKLPGDGWQRVKPMLAGICGSDLATIDGRSSRYFEPIVSFPFVPGHEVVGSLDDGTRVVLEPVLSCAARSIEPECSSCTRGYTGNCQNISIGHIKPGLQTGYCASTGGGWGKALVAHDSQLHKVPDSMTDEGAVMIEPAACAAHAALSLPLQVPNVVVLGAGTLGLCVIAALAKYAEPQSIIAVAKHKVQKEFAKQLGAGVIVSPGELARFVRLETGSLLAGRHLTGGADVVIDCVGNAESIATSLSVVKPRGEVILVGMPGHVKVDLTSLWHKEIVLRGAYAYGREESTGEYKHTHSFDYATELVKTANLHQLVSRLYPLERYTEAIEHAGAAGSRGAVKIAFDLRKGEK